MFICISRQLGFNLALQVKRMNVILNYLHYHLVTASTTSPCLHISIFVISANSFAPSFAPSWSTASSPAALMTTEIPELNCLSASYLTPFQNLNWLITSDVHLWIHPPPRSPIPVESPQHCGLCPLSDSAFHPLFISLTNGPISIS